MLHIDAQKDKKVPQKLWWVFLFLVFRKMPRLLACAIICGGIDVYFKLCVKIRQALRTTAGTCPFPSAVSCSTLWATP